jgi:hypothetical protein
MRFVSALLAAAVLFGWQASAQALVRIHIDLSTQSMHVASSEGEEYDWPVSTGRPGYRTPTGAYRPQRMYVMIHSIKYENAPMPHAIFFSGGYAIHGSYETGHLGRPASHGCVRLSPGHAAILFEMVKREGAAILITGAAPGRDYVVAARHRGGQRLAARWRRRYGEDETTYDPGVSPYEAPLRVWSLEPLDGQ